ncbi:hypothetical protein GCM10027435_21310 [Haloparvum alkalitolerans]|uniref:hypothetical protein n=1 Tax=Haloparvum alkalitolerans TaxID=1042953 RepID=UPI003CF66252
MSEDGPDLSVEEFVDYCRTQAGLLSGSVDTMTAEAEELLDEVDDLLDSFRERVDEAETGSADRPDAPTATPPEPSPDAAPAEDPLADLEREIERKQSLVEAKQARIATFRDLAAAYEELADELAAEAADGREALERVAAFEADRDAPAYFPERQTVLEAASDEEPDDEHAG